MALIVHMRGLTLWNVGSTLAKPILHYQEVALLTRCLPDKSNFVHSWVTEILAIMASMTLRYSMPLRRMIRDVRRAKNRTNQSASKISCARHLSYYLVSDMCLEDIGTIRVRSFQMAEVISLWTLEQLNVER